MPSTVFDCIDHVHLDHGVSIWLFASLPTILESTVGVDVVKLIDLRISPFRIAILAVKLHRVGMIVWDFYSVRLRNLFRPTYLILALRAEETRHLGRYHHFVTDEFSYGLAESSVIVPHAVLSHQNTLF